MCISVEVEMQVIICNQQFVEHDVTRDKFNTYFRYIFSLSAHFLALEGIESKCIGAMCISGQNSIRLASYSNMYFHNQLTVNISGQR